jgi:hypothetical protein
VLILHQVHDRSYFLGAAVEQPGPEMLIFASVMMMQDPIHELYVFGHDLRPFRVASSDTTNQRGHQTELSPEHGVNYVHVASISVPSYHSGHHSSILCCPRSL